MSARDIMPYKSPHGGHNVARTFPIAASQSFLEGEPVGWSSGQIVETAADEPDLETEFAGIAAGRSTDVNGTALAANSDVAVYVWDDETLWVSPNYSTDGAGSAASITGALRGTLVGLVVGSGVWYFDSHANTNKLGIIEDVLNARGQRVFGATAGTRIVVRGTIVRTAGAA